MATLIENQFLLNADGSVPAGVDPVRMQQLGIRMVVPQEPPHEYGFIAQEQEPLMGSDGRWYQQWTMVPYVAPEPVEVDSAALNTTLMDAIAALPDDTKQALLQALGQ